jgi:hypothetical protein
MTLAVADIANKDPTNNMWRRARECTMRLANTVLTWWLNLGGEPIADDQAE